MAKTIEDVEQLFTERGYACRRMSGQCVQTDKATSLL